MDLDFSEADIHRYSRHILLAELGALGQQRLAQARVLVVGAGGLGSPLLLYLAAAGVGKLGVVDHDHVELSNLQRQVAFTMADLGRSKAQAAAAAASARNPGPQVVAHACRLTADNAMAVIGGYDVICDGTDNFATRFLVADCCVLLRRTLVSAAVLRFEGQLSTFKPHARQRHEVVPCDAGAHPCYRCLYPAAPPPGLVPACSEAGVLGPVTGVMGTLQATEVLKEVLGVGEGLSGRLLVWDALAMRFHSVRLRADPACPACGQHASLRDLSAHHHPDLEAAHGH